MRPEEARVGMKVRVCEHHWILERRGMIGRIVSRYGGEEYIAVDVRFPDRQYRLFWPEDLEEISSSQSWWRSSGWRKQELEMKEHLFPKFEYYLDESDSDILILRRQDGSFVAAFSASGATREGIDEAAREDYGELVQAHTNALGQKGQERLSS
jgi:hypothetical protein